MTITLLIQTHRQVKKNIKHMSRKCIFLPKTLNSANWSFQFKIIFYEIKKFFLVFIILQSKFQPTSIII